MEIALQDLLQVWFGQLEPTLSRYLFFSIAVWLAIWIVLGSVLKARKIRDATPPGRQLLMELAYSLRSMAIFATVAVVIL